MKRKTALFGAVCAMLALGSCAMSAPLIVLDKNLPKEESVSIFFFKHYNSTMDVTFYNGVRVPVKTLKNGKNDNYAGFNYGYKYYGFNSNWHYVRLPPGEMEFEFSGISGFNPVYVVKEISFRYTFSPGDYVLYFTAFGGPDDDSFGINIYEQSVPVKFTRNGRPILENLIAFVPLPISKQSNVFE
jgi:hypothetical protein